ncbi:phage holin family protein [Streptomonospora sp. PA3]|uniref:phage holin family protein n=1 Tax=Streptomonospora sp. PA3 TaxID=2607326 RepID=UPI0012DF7C7E|nr:phage holin family protein [Streptomonospora sp. PA3]MUL44224.1 phage holin family protein [Streptomonospora sp. PA3]
MTGIPHQQRAEAAEPPTAEPSTAELVKRASEQISELVRDELRLGRLELREKGRRTGQGIGIFGASGLVALFGIGALVAAVILLLALVLPAWASALIVAGGLFVIAGVLALVGKMRVGSASPLKPEETMHSVQGDMTEIRERARR